MNILLVGFGSIGKRHYENLHCIAHANQIHVVTKQSIEGLVTFRELEDVPSLPTYDYFIIATETEKHYRELSYLCGRVKNKTVLVEKPLFDRQYAPIAMSGNQVFVAYNLRFHPVIVYLKEYLSGKETYFAQIFCGQYLPAWRPGRDYRKTYSADLQRGGGVLRDLSHEIDYCNWLFGPMNECQTINTKVSNLEISSDDLFTAIGVTDRKIVINLTMDYISKKPLRRIIVHTEDETVEADMIENTILRHSVEGSVEVSLPEVERNYTYRAMFEALLSGQNGDLCTFEEGLNIVSLFDRVVYRQKL